MRPTGKIVWGGISRDFSGSRKMPLDREVLTSEVLKSHDGSTCSIEHGSGAASSGRVDSQVIGICGTPRLYARPILCLNAHGIHT